MAHFWRNMRKLGKKNSGISCSFKYWHIEHGEATRPFLTGKSLLKVELRYQKCENEVILKVFNSQKLE
jgi:hypothetical protein